MTSLKPDATVLTPCDIRDDAPVARSRRGRPPMDVKLQRRRIHEVASDLFVQRGFAETSVEAIARAAGVTKRTIYDLIGDKEALFRSVCTELSVELCMFDCDATIAGRTTQDILVDVARTMLRSALDQKSLPLRRRMTIESERFPELLVAAMDVGRASLQGALVDMFSRLIEDGRITAVDPLRAADTFYDAIVGGKAMRAMMGYDEPFPDDHELQDRVEMIIHGFLQRQAMHRR